MRTLNTLTRTFVAAALAAVLASGTEAAEFVWRGQLADSGQPAEGSYDLSVTVHAEETGDAPLSEPIEFDAVTVTDGEFALPLALDQAADLDQVWLEIAVRDAGDPAGFETLNKRERVELQPAAVCPASWETRGNAGLGASNFLGTTDETAVQIRAGNRNALRILPIIAPAWGDAPNLVLGSRANAVVGTFVSGATISGGGCDKADQVTPCGANEVGGDFASVGGGRDNSAYGASSRVGGGEFNYAGGGASTVGGGEGNSAPARLATVPGGQENQAGGEGSFAAGRFAIVRDAGATGDSDGDEGTFVWSDWTLETFTSSGPNQFLIRANGGMAVNSASIPSPIDMVLANRSTAGSNVDLYLRTRAHARGINIAMIPTTGAAAMRIAQYDGVSFVDRIFLEPNGDFSVTAAAFKPGGGSWSSSSDARLKKSVGGLDGALDRMLALEGVSFEYADPDPAVRPAGRLMGFVAQQVQPLFPSWIGQDSEGYLTVGTQGFEALTVEAVRELRAEKDGEIAELRAQLESLRAQQQRLLARLGMEGGDEPRPLLSAAAERSR